jgi:choline dehydrogenase-like flavoprotein
LTDHVKAGFKRAWVTMADIQFAAGAREVLPLHEQARPCTDLASVHRMVAGLSDVAHHLGAGSAHVMGGCPMGATPEAGVVDQRGRHWTIPNLSIHDGSVLPTSVGANPQLSIYGLAHRFTTMLLPQLQATG